MDSGFIDTASSRAVHLTRVRDRDELGLVGAATRQRLHELEPHLRPNDRKDPSLALGDAVLAVDDQEIADMQPRSLTGSQRSLDDR